MATMTRTNPSGANALDQSGTSRLGAFSSSMRCGVGVLSRVFLLPRYEKSLEPLLPLPSAAMKILLVASSYAHEYSEKPRAAAPYSAASSASQPASTSRYVASKSPVYQGSATSAGRPVQSSRRLTLPSGSSPRILRRPQAFSASI